MRYVPFLLGNSSSTLAHDSEYLNMQSNSILKSILLLCRSTKLASFPALPVSNNDWYDPSSTRNRDPRIAQCIPDGKKSPQEFIADVLGRKRTRSKTPKKSKKKAKVEGPRALAFSPYVQDSQTMPSNEHQTAEEETVTEEECDKISSTFPADVQLVLQAAKSLGMSTSVRLRTIKKLSTFLHE